RSRLATVVQHVEEAAHRRIHGHIVEERAVISEGVINEKLLVSSHPAWQRNALKRRHHDLTQSKCHPLPKLILTKQRVLIKAPLQEVIRIVVSLTCRWCRVCTRCWSRLRPKRQIRVA